MLIPAGTFQMGCSPGDAECKPDEQPAHSVTISRDFWIGETPVTQAAYQKVMKANPSLHKGDQLPVTFIRWADADAYCKAVEMRLPTEAEYEYAARGGTTTARFGPVDDIAWSYMTGVTQAHPVRQKKPNAYGLYDMLGNVWAWTADWYGPYTADKHGRSDRPADGTGARAPRRLLVHRSAKSCAPRPAISTCPNTATPTSASVVPGIKGVHMRIRSLKAAVLIATILVVPGFVRAGWWAASRRGSRRGGHDGQTRSQA